MGNLPPARHLTETFRALRGNGEPQTKRLGMGNLPPARHLTEPFRALRGSDKPQPLPIKEWTKPPWRCEEPPAGVLPLFAWSRALVGKAQLRRTISSATAMPVTLACISPRVMPAPSPMAYRPLIAVSKLLLTSTLLE